MINYCLFLKYQLSNIVHVGNKAADAKNNKYSGSKLILSF